jgi:ribosomal protein S18 acetylase RimI-like enzyme
MHRLQHEDETWRIRAFLREVFLLNGRREVSWHVNRFDYWRWHGVENMRQTRLEDVHMWETEDGRIAAVLNPEGPGDAFLQVHPNLRTPALDEEMLAVAEKHLAAPGPDGQRKLWIWVDEKDEIRQGILERRGYARHDGAITEAHYRFRPLSRPIPAVPVAAGYTVRSLGGVEEFPARTYVSWQAFHPDEPDEGYEGWEWYHNIQRAPLYRRDLDIVAVAADGEFASFCTVWFDDVTRSGVFEPVGTAPAHQRRGLGKAVMCEGLRRLQRLGATMAYVGSYTPPAHALYASVGFRDYDLFELWVIAL